MTTVTVQISGRQHVIEEVEGGGYTINAAREEAVCGDMLEQFGLPRDSGAAPRVYTLVEAGDFLRGELARAFAAAYKAGKAAQS